MPDSQRLEDVTIAGRSFRYGALTLCLWPIYAYANVGVPLFTNFIVYSWLLLIPIIGIEAYLLKRQLKVSTGRASRVATFANIASTILGSVLVTGVGILFGIAGFSVLSGAQSDISLLVALIPCFYFSVWFESLVASPFLKQYSREDIQSAFYLANQFTYAMLAIVVIVRFIKSWIMQGQIIG